MRPKLEEIGARWNARVKVVEVLPGPPVLSPIVAEVYGPDEAGRIRVAKRVREALAATPGVVGIDDSVEEAAPRRMLRVDQGRRCSESRAAKSWTRCAWPSTAPT